MYLKRLLEDKLDRMAGLFPLLVLGGARQAGKSTLLAHLFGARASVTVFDPVTDMGQARADPDLFLRLNPAPLILDEVQYAPELLPALKRAVDRRPGEKGLYFLTGSQQLSVLAGVQESLAGRAYVCDLWPMTRGELAGAGGGGLLDWLYAEPAPDDAVALMERMRAAGPPPLPRGNLLERLLLGGYPGLLELPPDAAPDWQASYLRTYVERDVRVLRDVGQPHDFTRFVRLIAALGSQEMNFSQLGREIGISPRTARAWLDVMAASFQVILLDAYSGNTVKRISSRPKIHLVDSGLGCHLLGISSPSGLSAHPNLGAIFESHVVAELLKQAGALSPPPRAWHWRAASGAEVDLLLERDGRVIPVEIRLSSRPSRRDTSGLRALRDTYPRLRLGPRLIVHGGAELFLVDEDTLAAPVDWV
jgi:predicted AAA+ superfamily ATPase